MSITIEVYKIPDAVYLERVDKMDNLVNLSRFLDGKLYPIISYNDLMTKTDYLRNNSEYTNRRLQKKAGRRLKKLWVDPQLMKFEMVSNDKWKAAYLKYEAEWNELTYTIKANGYPLDLRIAISLYDNDFTDKFFKNFIYNERQLKYFTDMKSFSKFLYKYYWRSDKNEMTTFIEKEFIKGQSIIFVKA